MDIGETIESIVSWLIRVASGLGLFLPIAIFAIFNLISGNRKKQQQQDPNRRAQPAPNQPVTTTSPQTRRDDVFRRDDTYRHEDDALRWGSAFAANDAEKAESGLRWGSVFDEEREQTKWGWDEAEWGGGYAKKRDTEPTITIG